MGLFNSISESLQLFVESWKTLLKYPIFLLPLFFSWILVAGLVLYLNYYFIWPASVWVSIVSVEINVTVLIAMYLFIFLITLIIIFANFVMLELIEQIESGRKVSIIAAFKEAVSQDFLKAIPIAAVWSLLWLLILILKILASKRKNKGARPTLSAKAAALTLGGANSSPFSWIKLGLNMLEKLIRLVVFLSLPAIAWEKQWPISGTKKAFDIIRKHTVQFLSSYSLTSLTFFLMAVPLVIIFYLNNHGTVFSAEFWLIVLIYEGLIWTLNIYLEQMTLALLYIWHLKWEKSGAKGELSKVQKPSLLDEIKEFNSE